MSASASVSMTSARPVRVRVEGPLPGFRFAITPEPGGYRAVVRPDHLHRVARRWLAADARRAPVRCRQCGRLAVPTSPGGLPVGWTDAKDPVCAGCA